MYTLLMRLCLLLLCATALAFGQHAAPAADTPNADAALKMLIDGNQRYVTNRLNHPHQDVARRTQVATAQHPFAAILSCADSRVPPEVVFDEGLGDIFSVRVAGNVATDDVVASLEYAVAHLGPKLIVVLGHERCGAVDATMKGGAPEGHLATLVNLIKPATDSVKGKPGDALDLAIRQNVANVVKQLRESQPILGKAIAAGTVKIVGARYDLDTGAVELLK